MVLAPEAIARRNAAAIEPDRIQTRCRDDGARAQVFATIEQVSRTAGLVGPASDSYRHSKSGVSRCATALRCDGIQRRGIGGIMVGFGMPARPALLVG
jgi:hypothetical protein